MGLRTTKFPQPPWLDTDLDYSSILHKYHSIQR